MAVKPPIHGRDHCPGGADPIPCLESSSAVAILTGWEAIDTGEIAADIWQAVTADGFFNDGYTTPGASVAVDLDSGEMTFPVDTLVHAHGWVQFSGTFAAGDVVGVAINSTAHRIVNAVTIDAANVPAEERIAVSGGFWHPTTPVTFQLQAFHTSATEQTIVAAQMTASVEAPLDDEGWEVHA